MHQAMKKKGKEEGKTKGRKEGGCFFFFEKEMQNFKLIQSCRWFWIILFHRRKRIFSGHAFGTGPDWAHTDACMTYWVVLPFFSPFTVIPQDVKKGCYFQSTNGITLLSIHTHNDIALSCEHTCKFLVATSIINSSSSKLYPSSQIWQTFPQFFFLWSFQPDLFWHISRKPLWSSPSP